MTSSSMSVFNKDESLGIEGVTAYFNSKNGDDYELRFYSFLSTDKTQDNKVVYTNIKLMLEHIKSDTMEGTEVCWKIIDLLKHSGIKVRNLSTISVFILLIMSVVYC